jgi:predicted AlkP superfamily pyrophosphatase or phosphodiesterase
LLTGKHGVGYWAESKQTHWTTSSAYTTTLPKWITEYNREDNNNAFHMKRWRPLYTAQHYTNSKVAVMEGITSKTTTLIKDVDLTLANTDFGKMCYTPAGNSMALKFAFQYITKEALGKDEHPDILNISLDTARYIAETYGTESMEYEDMLYRLDKDIEDFLVFLLTEFSDNDETVMFAPADGFYFDSERGKNKMRLAYVLESEQMRRAVELIRLGLEAYEAKQRKQAGN